jgi:hypothetical protein
MKTLYVCGDSFLTPSANYPETHFTEIISKRIGYELKVLAHGGMSNNGICLQIESAIKNNASFVIVSPTYYDRMEIPIKHKSTYYDASDLFYSCGTYCNYDNSSDKALISDSIISLVTAEMPLFKSIKNIDEKLQAVREYFNDLYDPVWKEQQDNWSLYAALHKLHESNIPYLMILDRLSVAKKFNWLTEKTNTLPLYEIVSLVHSCIAQSKKMNVNVDPGYHTLPEDQVIIAEKLLSHLDKFKMLD